MATKYESAWSKSIPTKEQFKIVKRLFSFTKPYKKQFIGTILAAGFLAVINIMLPKLLQIYMDNYLVKKTATTKVIMAVAGLYLLGVILKAILQFLQDFLSQMGAERTLEDVRITLFSKLHKLGMRYFDQTPAGSIVSRVTNDTMTLADFWNVFLTIIVGIFSVVSAFVAMYYLNAKIALIMLLFLPVLLGVIWYYQHYSSKVYRHMREKLSELNTKLNESIEGISVIQQFRQEKRITDEFEKTNKDYLASRVAMIRTNSLLLSPIINLLYTVGLLVVLGLFGIDAMHNPVEAGVVYAFTTYVSNFFDPMRDMMDFMSNFQDGVVAGSRIFRILDNEEYSPAQNEGASEELLKGKVEFRHVTFSYDGKTPVLKDINLIANPGETIALVGHTGSGKSSIINVLMRFYEFYEGEILLDDKDIRDYPLEELREKMGLVLQDPFMFYGDISNNIRLFNQNITDEQVEKAAEFVQADKFINELPGRYHARVIERGAQYSSGQRQLISFARTIVTNPKILVLDEATANIDTETEELIQDGLKQIRKGRTTIAIAHRLSTIRDAKEIIVLNQGRIIERGTHDELIAKHGYYYDMNELQNGGVES